MFASHRGLLTVAARLNRTRLPAARTLTSHAAHPSAVGGRCEGAAHPAEATFVRLVSPWVPEGRAARRTLLAACGGGSPSSGPEDGAIATPDSGTVAGNARAIVLGDIADDPAKKIATSTPLADYLTANLGELGITEGRVKIAPDMETMAQWLEAGEVDLCFEASTPR